MTPVTLAFGATLVLRAALYSWRFALTDPTTTAPAVMGHAQIALFLLGILLGLVWLYRAWTRVPASSRRTYDGRRIEPGEAVSRLFIPIYNLYWLFIANVGLCGALERQARAQGARLVAPSSLAMAACLVQLIPYVGILVGPLVWLAFMARVDKLQSTLDA